MRSDPDHVLDAIDGAVEDWESLSADAMRWAPPEHDSTPDFLDEMTKTFGPLAASVLQVLRPLGEAVIRPVSDFLDSPVGQRLVELGSAPEQPLELEAAPVPETACQCLCFRHLDQPDICTNEAVAGGGIPMCGPCRAALGARPLT